MAKKSKIYANKHREAIVARYAERRRELKKRSINPHLSEEERASAQAALQSLPRNASPTRLRNRDMVDGRPRGYLGKFGLSRVRFRKLASEGELPGVTKASW